MGAEIEFVPPENDYEYEHEHDYESRGAASYAKKTSSTFLISFLNSCNPCNPRLDSFSYVGADDHDQG
jgi:hypothetical protein